MKQDPSKCRLKMAGKCERVLTSQGGEARSRAGSLDHWTPRRVPASQSPVPLPTLSVGLPLGGAQGSQFE